ncbi:superoxide dismutase [Myroides sp. LJL119]
MNKLRYAFLSIWSIILFSCNDNQTLTEIEIPERETFIVEKTEFPDPASIKTLQGPFDMPGLAYRFDQFTIVEPKTAYSHYQNYHLGYANALNTAIHNTQYEKDSIVGIVKKVGNNDSNIKNLSGAYLNHNIYWKSLEPNIQTTVSNELEQALKSSFGSLQEFNNQFKNIALNSVGSGWIWLIKKSDNTLSILWTPNNENPFNLPATKQILFGIDLWEHAYVTTYPNDMKSYIEKCLKTLNWEYANEQYQKK